MTVTATSRHAGGVVCSAASAGSGKTRTRPLATRTTVSGEAAAPRRRFGRFYGWSFFQTQRS